VSDPRRPHLSGVRKKTAALASVLARTLEGSITGQGRTSNAAVCGCPLPLWVPRPRHPTSEPDALKETVLSPDHVRAEPCLRGRRRR
jgi:hypothetical protein